jgi:hypothetical protein
MNDGIAITGREDITGVRIIFAKRSGVIRGQVNVTGGAAPKDWRLSVVARGERKGFSVSGGFGGPVEVNSRGQFVIEGLTPGEYELSLTVNPEIDPNSAPSPDLNIPAPVIQKVIVPKATEAHVTMTLDLSRKNQEEK